LDSVQIQILDSANNIEGILDVGDVENFPLSLSNSIFDLTDINTNGGSFSLPFKVPSTKENDDLLEHLYLSQHKNYKDFDAEKDCRVIINDTFSDAGRLKITRIKREGRSANDYSFTFFGDNMDWALKLKSKTTQDIPHLDNTFTYGQSEIISSWSNTAGSNLPVYALINRGAKVQTGAVNVIDLFPDYFAVDYLNGAFKSIGYNFSSSFFEASDKANLIIPFFGNNFRDFDRVETDTAVVKMDSSVTNFDNTFTIDGTALTLDQIFFEHKLLNYQGTSFTGGRVDFSSQIKVADYDDTPSPLKDAAGNFASNQYVVPYDNKYTVGGLLDYTITYNPNDTWDSYYIDHRVKVTRGSQNIYLFAYTNNTTTTTTVLSSTRTQVRTTANFNTAWFALQAGDVLELTYMFVVKKNAVTPTTYYFSLSHQNLPITFKPYNFFQEGDTFNWKDVSDDKISLLDIVRDIGKVHNIVFRVDRKTKTVYAETRNDFYNELTTAENHTDRLDPSKQFEITYNSSYYKRNHTFKYKEDDKDDYLKARNDELDDEWMSYAHAYSDKFKEGVSKLETKVIGATYTVLDTYSGSNFPFYTARMWNDETLPPASTNFSPRLLYFNYNSQQTIDGQTCDFQFASESSKRTTIPYALPFPVVQDGITLASVDGVLSFKDVDGGDGLWKSLFSVTANEIVEGKRAKVYFKFDLVDYQSFDFRKVIYIDNRYPELEGYWRVEKVINFKPTSRSITTQFEIIQAKNFEALTKNSKSGIQTETGNDTLSNNYFQVGSQVDVINSSSNTQRSVNTGNNNQVADDSNIVFGNNLRVTGSNQVVMGRFNADVSSDLFQLGTGSGDNDTKTLIRVDENGNTFFNGVQIIDNTGLSGGLIVDISSDITADEIVDTYLVDTSGGNVTITLPMDVYIGKTWNIKKMTSANNLKIEGDSDGMGSKYPIDEDTAGVTISTQYDVRAIKKSNNNKFIIV